MEDLYQVLGVPHDANKEQIRLAYRKQAIVHHPDKGGDAEIFKELSKAYQILSDDSLRAKYDNSLPIENDVLISPLKVFSECFNQWLSQYPLMDVLLKDSCNNVIKLLNDSCSNPIVRLLIDSLTHPQPSGYDDILKNTVWNHCENDVKINKKMYVTLDDIYVGKRYAHMFAITNEDLCLPNDYRILNPDIHINVPLDHDEVDIETDLYIYKQNEKCGYIQKIFVQLDVILNHHPNYNKINDMDVLLVIDVTLDQLINQKIVTLPYLNHKILRFHNPNNCNLRQLYKIENIGLPNREQKKRGDLYVMFNLIIHKNQSSMIVSNSEQGYIHTLIPVSSTIVCNNHNLPTYSMDGLIITNIDKI